MLKKISSLFALIAMAFTGVLAISAPASADPLSSNDATLSSLSLQTASDNDSFRYYSTSLVNSFSPDQTYYEAYSSFQDVDFFAAPTDGGATVKVTGGDQTNTVMDPVLPTTIHFPIAANNLVTITVTAADGTTTKAYKVNLSAQVMPQPEIISYSNTNASTAGGEVGVAYVKHFYSTPNPWQSYCFGNPSYSYTYTDSSGQTQQSNNWMYGGAPSAPDDNGVVKVLYETGNLYYRFRDTSTKINFVFSNRCNLIDKKVGNWYGAYADTIVPNAVTLYNPTVTKVEAPATISQMTPIKISGPGMSSDAGISFYLQDPTTGDRLWMDTQWIDNNSLYAYPSPYWGDSAVWNSPGKVKLVIDQAIYDEGGMIASQNLYTQDINFTPEVATQVSLTPAKGPLAGGNTVKITGHHLCNYGFNDDEDSQEPVITIGGQQVTNLSIISGCDEDSWYASSDGKNFDGLDKLSFTVPAGMTAGAADLTLDIGYGPTKSAVKYTYGAKPTVTAIAPSIVANTGGSIVTITGTNFGSAGTPTVIIDGNKSPYVKRLSDTKVLAMVPASSSTGAVEVQLISASGGGALDVPATLTYAAASTNPTISGITPNNGGVAGGDVITISGTGFDLVATGVTIAGIPAKVTAATATSLTVETPTADNAGAADIVVGTPTGIATSTGGYTFNATPGITSVSPSSIKTTDTGAATKVTITGLGFGASGSIKVGSAAATSYTSTNGGTTIANVTIPNTAAGSVAVAITPTGAKVPFTTSVRVNGPVVTYFGPNPYDSSYGSLDLKDNGGWATPGISTAGGESLLIQGRNFGSAGVVKIGNTSVTPTAYNDTTIVFTAPALSAGTYDVTVAPAIGAVTAVLTARLYVGPLASATVVTSIQSSVDNARSEDRNTFDPVNDASDLFVITGKGFLSTDNGAKTTVTVSVDGTSVVVTPASLTNTTITFHAPHNMPFQRWATVVVNTATHRVQVDLAIYYVGILPQGVTFYPGLGLCTKDPVGPYQPSAVAASGSGVFGETGTVTIDGTKLDQAAYTWNADQVLISFANQPVDLPNPWGSKLITFTPDDTNLAPQTFTFVCGVLGSVTTQIDGSSADQTISAGTPYTASADWLVGIPDTSFNNGDKGYFYQSAGDYGIYPRGQNVQRGLPVAAGDWYIWANTNSDTGAYDTTKYWRVDADNVVHLTITGNPVTITPKLSSGNGNTKVYSGQLGDGTNGSPNDITYTASSTADAITSVTWQYRNHFCATNDPNYGWSSGLPNAVAVEPGDCGGDGTTVTSWDIRVASFEMKSGSVDKSIYYLPTLDTFNLTITKKDLTISAVKAQKVYDGNTSVTLGAITVTGAIDGDEPTLDPSFASGAQFNDATVGTNKQIVLSGPFQLGGVWGANYNLTNPDLQVTGNITKADAILRLTPALNAVILGNTPTVDLAVSVTDAVTAAEQSPDANAATPVITSKTPSVCTVDAGVITIIAAGDCVIDGTQAASANYNAAVSYHDNTSTTEEVVIKVYGAPKDVSIIADDIQIAVGDSFNPTFITTGLLDGDSYDWVDFDYYQGNTLLQGAPTEVGTYRIVPKGGALGAADAQAYSGVVKYVAGTLVITAVPPTISASSPAHGPEAGGNTLVITGSGLDTVTSITIGDLTIRKPDFVVNGDGTEITLVMPAGVGAANVVLNAGSAQVSTDYTYDPNPVVPPNPAPLNINLELKLKIGAKFSGQPVFITGGGLKANSQYVLVMHSKELMVHTGITDANGDFAETIVIPAKACLKAGRHDLTLTGISPAGDPVKSIGYFTLDDQCHVTGQAVQTGSKTWTLTGFLFDFLKDKLTAKGVKSLKALSKFIKGAKKVTIYGYTETTHSKAVHKYNLKLSQGRCNTVKAFLKKLGIKATYKTVPLAGKHYVSLKNQYLNRRVVITADF
jgi:outer membrane protein OmpA-like peptidoglycan-associated protein